MAMTAKLFGDRGRRRAEKLGIPVERLPPGQSPTEKFPVLSIWDTPKVPTVTWSFSVHGEVEAPFALTWAELLALPQREQTSDLHCVTRWSKFDTRWTGTGVRELIERARPAPGATHAMIHGHDGYTTNLPLEALLDDDVLIVHHFGREPLAPEHGGPARLLVPRRYLWKSAKWVSAIELLDHDEPGVWERNGYHNEGDPWSEERRSSRPFVPLRRRSERPADL